MAIKVGDVIPNIDLYKLSESGPEAVSTQSIFHGKTVVMFALPGAFTPTCSAAHLPGFVVNADALREMGVDSIACVSVNDAWVMDAWGQQNNAEEIQMLGDGSADFTDAIGLTTDLTSKGMGVRSQRYAMIVKDGEVVWLGIDEPGVFENSSAESVLSQLPL